MRIFIVATYLLGFLAVPRLAQAGETKQAERDKTEHAKEDTIDIGALGGVGFPRPFAIEAVVRLNKIVMLGAEYGFLPKLTFSSVNVRLWSAAADLRVFPFKGAFFVGLRGGYQSLSGAATLTAENVGSYTESIDVGTWFVNPRLGFLWVWKPLSFGIDAGVQIPVSTTIERSSLLAAVSPMADAEVRDATNLLGRTVLPTIDLLRVGLVF